MLQLEHVSQQKLAEFAGILLGDGSLALRTHASTMNRMKITLDSTEDMEYTIYVRELIFSLFGTYPIIKQRKNERAIDIFIFKKEIVTYLVETLGLKVSPKWEHAEIPSSLLEQGSFVARGYFDTDGCVTITNNNGTLYPRIEMKVSPSPLQFQLIEILRAQGLNIGAYQIGKGKVRIQLNGKKQVHLWMKRIGSSNPKHLRKIARFEK